MLEKSTAAWGSLREAASFPRLLCTLSGGFHERILSSPFHSTESTVKPTPVHLPLKGVVSSDDSGQRTHSQGLEVGIGTSAGKALIEARSPGFRFAHVEGKLCPSWSSLVEPAIVGGTGAAPGASRCWPQSFSPSRVHALRQVPSQLLPRMGIKSSLASEFEAWRGNGFGWKESRQ